MAIILDNKERRNENGVKRWKYNEHTEEEDPVKYDRRRFKTSGSRKQERGNSR